MIVAFRPYSLFDEIFMLAALIGGLGVVAQVLLLLMGGDHGEALEGDGLDGAGEVGDGFRFLSLFGLSGFLTMFGLVGIALSRQTRLAPGPALLGGVLAGAAAIAIIARLFRFASSLQTSGTLSPQAALGCRGNVYLTIPAGGTGRVTVRIGKRLREMDAIHVEGAELATGTAIRVVRVDRSLAVVRPLSPEE